MAILDSLKDHYTQVRQWIEDEVNFFRLHLIYFTIVPLIAAGIFYAANGEFHIREWSMFSAMLRGCKGEPARSDDPE